MGWLSDIGSIAGSLIGAGASSAAQNKQNQDNRENYKMRHQWETEDLSKAGLNRILSATGGGSVASAGMADVAGGINSGSSAAKAIGEMGLIKAQEDANKAQAGLNSAQKTKTEVETGLIEPKTKSEIGKINSDTSVNNAMIEKINTDKELNSAKRGLTNAEKRRVEQEEQRIKGDPRTMIGKVFSRAENAATSAKKHESDWKDTGVLGIRYRKVKR